MLNLIRKVELPISDFVRSLGDDVVGRNGNAFSPECKLLEDARFRLMYLWCNLESGALAFGYPPITGSIKIMELVALNAIMRTDLNGEIATLKSVPLALARVLMCTALTHYQDDLNLRLQVRYEAGKYILYVYKEGSHDAIKEIR